MTNNSPFFTIVVPGYESATYIGSNISALKAQTFPDFECLIVVEESSDNSSEVAKNLTKDDSRFIVVDRPKSGSASASRNYAIKNGKGLYMVCVDGDDWIEPDALERIAKAIKQYEWLDVLQATGYEVVVQADGSLKQGRMFGSVSEKDENRLYTGHEFMVRMNTTNFYNVLNICRLEFLRKHDLYQVEGIQLEDTEWTPRVWFYAERMAALAYPFYKYRRHADSVQGSCSPRLLLSLGTVLDRHFSFLEDNAIPPDVLKVWCNSLLKIFYWYFFHGQYQDKFSKETRCQALDIFLGTKEKRERYCRVLRSVSLTKRMTTPFILRAARKHSFWLVNIFFRSIYFPLSKVRQG